MEKEASLHPEPFHSFPGRFVALVLAGSLSLGSPSKIHMRINVRYLIGFCSVWQPDTCKSLVRVLRFDVCLDEADTSDETSALLNCEFGDRYFVTSFTASARFCVQLMF
jgi:hypothetical protein